MKFSTKFAAMSLCLLMGATLVVAQDANKAADNPTVQPLVHLRVDLLLTEYNGEKKIDSLPYTLVLRIASKVQLPAHTSAWGSECRSRLAPSQSAQRGHHPRLVFSTNTKTWERTSMSTPQIPVCTSIDCDALLNAPPFLLQMKKASYEVCRRWPICRF